MYPEMIKDINKKYFAGGCCLYFTWKFAGIWSVSKTNIVPRGYTNREGGADDAAARRPGHEIMIAHD